MCEYIRDTLHEMYYLVVIVAIFHDIYVASMLFDFLMENSIFFIAQTKNHVVQAGNNRV